MVCWCHCAENSADAIIEAIVTVEPAMAITVHIFLRRVRAPDQS